MALIGYCNRAEAITREEFKVRVQALYVMMEQMAKEDGCQVSKRYWQYGVTDKQVILYTMCLDNNRVYYLSTPNAHQHIRNDE